jgi:hypothetical protein
MTDNPLYANLSLQTVPGSDSTNEPGSAVLDGPQTPGRGIADRSLRGTQDPDRLPHGCKCGARWSGGRTAHCPADCHKTFSGVTGFDAHRRNGQCLDPASIGLTLQPGRAYECWGTSEEQS